ncbi:MAG: hypothetical protein ACOYM2_06115 [Rectinemataceae bacterium]
MNPFDRYRGTTTNHQPRTAHAALAAALDGVLPFSEFIALSVATRALSEGDFEQLDFERIISRPDLNIETRFILKYALARHLESEDVDEVYFAAECLGELETKMEDMIDGQRKLLSKDPNNSEHASLLARSIYHQGLLSEDTMRTFYMREALGLYIEVLGRRQLRIEDTIPLFRILMILGMYAPAEGLIKKRLRDFPHSPEFTMCMLEVLFGRRDFPAMIRLLEPFRHDLELPEHLARQVRTWLGEWEEM